MLSGSRSDELLVNPVYLWGSWLTFWESQWNLNTMRFHGDWTSWEYDWMPRVCHSYLTKACSFQRFCSVVATGQNIAIFVVRSRWKAQVGARVFFLRAQNSTRWWSQTLLEFLTSKFGEMIQFDDDIFQMGWFNDKLVKIIQKKVCDFWWSS